MTDVPVSGPSFDQRLARAKFRSWHRGTREADYMIGGFYDRYHSGWGEDELAWFEALLDEAAGHQARARQGAGHQPRRVHRLGQGQAGRNHLWLHRHRHHHAPFLG
jgi:hypothetical protein